MNRTSLFQILDPISAPTNVSSAQLATSRSETKDLLV